MSEQDEAVKLARELAAIGHVTEDIDVLAQAVIAQDEELSALTACQRCGRGDLQLRHLAQHLASCMSRTDEEHEIDELKQENDDLTAKLVTLGAEFAGQRLPVIALKAALREALDLADQAVGFETEARAMHFEAEVAAVAARIVELRRLT